MDLLLDFLVTLSRWCRGHLDEIALALVAALLVLFGPWLNAWLQHRVGGLNFMFRTLLFVALCTLGYGMLIVHATPWLTRGLAQLNNHLLAPALILVFVCIGGIAARR
ncbi:DUF3392 family protein [Azotobacter salinestris]|uniref:DUF3392 family protein n=1 Tax=Azotobacter salinestris TaxID=69964 RepID=UPI0032DE9DFD